MRAGELPLELIRMRVRLGYEEDEDGYKEWKVKLDRNEPGFTLPSNIDELGNDVTELDLDSCSLRGVFAC